MDFMNEQLQKQIINGGSFDEERAFYGSHGIVLNGVSIDGAADGESAFKECSDVECNDCFFNLRYPFWHDIDLVINNSEMTSLCRAALWYSRNVCVTNTKMHGIKAFRECQNVKIECCDIISPEFGWSVDGIEMAHSKAESEYFMMRSSNIKFKDVEFKGKYSFQYISHATFESCNFDTKDAFWHAHDVYVKNSVVKGEYLAWYADGLTFENCTIIGTQPLCYCKNLTLINCKMIGCDLSFEKSDVSASITSHVDSIKNVLSGEVRAASIGEIICDSDEYVGKVIVDTVLLQK